jgi:hypothetical protein
VVNAYDNNGDVVKITKLPLYIDWLTFSFFIFCFPFLTGVDPSQKLTPFPIFNFQFSFSVFFPYIIYINFILIFDF